MTEASDRIRIQNAIVDFALAGKFHPVTYTVSGGGRHAVEDTTKDVAPASAVCNEIRATFKPAKVQRRSLSQDRDQWFFQLHVAFDQEVTLEAFERTLDAIPVLGRDSTHTKNVTFELFQANYQHPTQSEPQPGSKATYTIIARVSPN